MLQLTQPSSQWMEAKDSPPPVPPKDTPYLNRNMEIDLPPSAPASASKRKRSVHDDPAYCRGQEVEESGIDRHTPKRTRASTRQQSEVQHSTDSTPVQERTIRRKKKSNNLSNLNLRHAAAQHARRESKFQEGSLTDKPSEEPPGLFIRFVRTDSGNVKQVDDLMADYHDNVSTPRDSADSGDAGGKTADAMNENQADDIRTSERSDYNGFFRFGRTFAGFHPVTLWNKLWHETKEELRKQDLEEAESRRKLKEEAERKYAELKQAGLLPAKFVSRPPTGTEASTPRDSGIEMEDIYDSIEHKHQNFNGSTEVALARDDLNPHGDGEMPSTSTRPKTLASRLHLKKPSLTNLKLGFKRTASELNLAAVAAAQRDSSSSASPIKQAFGHDFPNLRKSSSRYDMRKQQKLSKRVSDLESKLQQARRELDDAIQEASPMPKLSGRYERFTPSNTVRSRRFVPGALPTLPSERLFSPELMGGGTPRADEVNTRAEGRDADIVSKSDDVSLGDFSPVKVDRNIEDKADEDTIRAMKGGRRQYPPRADSIFQHVNANIEAPLEADQKQPLQSTSSELHQLADDDTDILLDLDGTTQSQANEVHNVTELAADGTAINGDFKHIDDTTKTPKGNTTSKKRKSAKHKAEDAAYRPGKESEEDDLNLDMVDERPKKKNKNGNTKSTNKKSPQTKSLRSKKGLILTFPQSKVDAENAVGDDLEDELSKDTEHLEFAAVSEEQEHCSEDEHAVTNGDNAGAADEIQVSMRMSTDSQILDPVFEEEEESIAVATHVDMTNKTRDQSRARFTLRNRSRSPSKQYVPAGPEEKVMTKAAYTAKERRLGDDQAAAGAAVREKGSFEWPDDVF